MLTLDPIVLGDDALDAIKTYLRLTSDDDDAALATLAIAAVATCEGVTGRILIARGATESVTPGCGWTRLRGWPVTAIGAVSGDDGTAVSPDACELDIDADATGRVRAVESGRRLRVAYRVGTAARWSGIDEPLRQGMLVFVADRYAARDRATDGTPPPAIAALWRSGRRLRLR